MGPTGNKARSACTPFYRSPLAVPRSAGGGLRNPPQPSLLTLRMCLLVVLRRFSSNAALTTEEQEQRAIYAAILEYEQDHVCRGVGAKDRAMPARRHLCWGCVEHGVPWKVKALLRLAV